jgi:lipid-binding SYLF domain-containing protein
MKNTSTIVVSLIVIAALALGVSSCAKKEAPPAAEESKSEVVEQPAPEAPAADDDAEKHAEEAAPAADPDAQDDDPEWKNMKQEAKATKIDETADETLAELFAENAKAKDLYARAHGWAVFDNLKLALGVSGGGGNGVAVNKGTGERTYMKMGTGGIGLGIGVNKYQVVFLFEDPQTFDNFVNKGWQADAGATASAGKAHAEVKTDFVNGLAIYQLTEKGLMANADIAGTKYWKNDKLND